MSKNNIESTEVHNEEATVKVPFWTRTPVKVGAGIVAVTGAVLAIYFKGRTDQKVLMNADGTDLDYVFTEELDDTEAPTVE